jgi:hypothetical protein
MRKLLLILFTPFFLTACETEPQASVEGCPTPGSKQVIIHYGDSKIRVTPAFIKNVKLGSKLNFKLEAENNASDPAGIDYEKVKVTIQGKTSEGSQWLWVAGTEDADGTLSVCAPQGKDKVGVYEYLVNVDTVGQLDPRADVEN